MDYSIVLSDELLKEFYNFKRNLAFNNNIIDRLLLYYKPPHITNFAQLKRVGIEDRVLISQLINKGLNRQTLEELSDKTIFKVILDKKNSNYPYVNIFQDEIENNYTATFKRNSRDKAREHIKALLKNANSIFIYDKYLSSNDYNWSNCKKFFVDLIPKKPLTIFYKKDHLKQTFISDIKKIYRNWKIKENKGANYRDLHDRYLVIDNKMEIILTSGFNYLFDEDKDFTYLIRTLNENKKKSINF